MPEEEVLHKLASFFKNFSDPTRLKILYILSISEMCGQDLAAMLNISTSAISQQLRVLRNADLVKLRKEGKVVYFSLKDHHIETIFTQGLTHINE
jgi:DNA-binding transcriptional ArsR family regulator